MAKRLSEESGRIITPDEAYATRHGEPGADPNIMRMKWYNYMNEYREKDPALLIRDCLEHSDIVCGVRDKKELLAARDEGLLDLVVWIENQRVPSDPTVTFTVDDADIIVQNNSTFKLFYEHLTRLAAAFGLLIE